MTAPCPTCGTPRPRGRPRQTARDAAIREAARLDRAAGMPRWLSLRGLAAQYGLAPATVRRIVARGRRSEAPPTPPAAPHGAIASPGDPDPR